MHPISFPSLDTGTSLSELWSDFQIRFSEVQPLMLKFLANEIFPDLVTLTATWKRSSDPNQWIALEYSAIRQSFSANGFRITGVHLHMKWFVGLLVIIHKNETGYEEEDIRKYLTNSFEALIWTGAISSGFSDIDLSSSSDCHLQHLLRNHLDYQYFAGFPHTLFNRTYNHFFHFL